MYTRKMTDDKVWSKAEAIYARPGLVSDEEWFNTLLHWLSESETEDLTVDSEGNPIESVPIKSYANYQAWKVAHQNTEKGDK